MWQYFAELLHIIQLNLYYMMSWLQNVIIHLLVKKK